MTRTITVLQLFFVIIGLCCFMPAIGFCDDLNDGFESDTPITKEDSISQKQGNTSFAIRKATAADNKKSREQKKEADEYKTYEFKGPLGNTYKVKLKPEGKQKSVPESQADGMYVNSVVVKPGAKAQDITVINKSNAPIVQINK